MDNSQQIFNTMKAHFAKGMATLPTIIANEMVNFSKERFREQNWRDTSALPWKKRKSKKNSSRAILRKSGRLARSIRPIVKGDMAGIGSDVPYAKAHNEGVFETVTVKAHTRNKYSKSKTGTGSYSKTGKERMKTITSVTGVGNVKTHSRKMKLPRRQFAGSSKAMMERLKKAAAKHLYKFLQK